MKRKKKKKKDKLLDGFDSEPTTSQKSEKHQRERAAVRGHDTEKAERGEERDLSKASSVAQKNKNKTKADVSS